MSFNSALTRLLPVLLISAGCMAGATTAPIPITFGGNYISTAYTGEGGEGTFAVDNEIQMFSFTITNPNTSFYVSSYSWVELGGFAPILTLYTADGTQIAGGTSTSHTYPDCGTLGSREIAPETPACLDAFLQASLNPGDYLLALTQYGNDPQGDLSAGFYFDLVEGVSINGCVSPNFTGNSENCQGYGAQGGGFYAAYEPNPQLNGIWAISVAADAVPEPATGLMILSGLGLLAIARRVRSRN